MAFDLPLAERGGDPQERADAARNRRKILEAAQTLFAERGVECVSMDDVARAAHVGKGTLYRRFGDRASLAFALLDERERALQEACIRGELTIKGITRDVVATGTWTPPAESPYGIEVAALELAAQLDRTQFGMTWNAPLPKGGNILDEKVTLTVHLELQAQA